MLRPLLAGFLLIVVANPIRPDGSPAPPDGKRVQELVAELGSEVFVRRERATKELEAMGPAIVESLREAAKNPDLEISRRASELVRKAEEKIHTAAFLKPKMVRLQLNDIAVLEAVSRLSKASGYAIQVIGDASRLRERKITLDTGETTFWQAFDLLCERGGLVDVNAGGATLPPASSTLRNLKIAPALPAPLPPPPPKKAAIGGPVGLAAQFQAAKGGVLVFPSQATANPTVLFVQDGTPRRFPTSYQGSLRIRAILVGRVPQGLPEHLVALEVTPEPRFHGFRVVSTPRTDKAVDDQGQRLQAVETKTVNDALILNRMAVATSGSRAMICLKLGEKPAKTLSEFAGRLEVEGLQPTEAVLTVDDPARTVGKSVQSKDGRTLTIQSLTARARGEVQLRAILQGPADTSSGIVRVPAGGAIQLAARVQIAGNARVSFMGRPTSGQLPILLDENGKALELTAIGSSRSTSDGIVLIQEIVATYRGDEGRMPARLVLNGQRRQMVQVPFAFKDLPLP